MLEEPQPPRRITVQVPVPYWTASSPDAIHSVVTPIREAAARGDAQNGELVRRAGADASDERIYIELLLHLWEAERWHPASDALQERLRRAGRSNMDLSDLGDEVEHADVVRVTSEEFLLQGLPEGAVVPPQTTRDGHKAPDLRRANPSFSALLLMYIRDRFDGDAPSVYHAAHVSRKTYSAIVSNELRPVSKQTAIAFALALRLTGRELLDFLGSAGFALSEFMLEDMIVRRCVIAGIYDVDRVNEILAVHGVKPLVPPHSEL